MTAALVLFASITLQVIAAGLALRLIRVTQKRLAWALLAAAISLMAFRRTITLFRLLTGDITKPPDLVAELVALVISILMVSGIATIGPVFFSIINSEDSLRRSQLNLAKAERIAKLGNWDWNIVTNKLAWSDEIYRIFGLDPEEFGANYEAFLNSVHPDDRRHVQDAVDAALNENKEYNIEHRVIRPNGEEIIAHEQAEVTFDEGGNPVGMFGTVQDITKMKMAEEARYKSEVRLSNIQDNASDAIIMINWNQIITSFNKGAEAIFGYDADEVIGQRLGVLLPSPLVEAHKTNINNFAKSKEISRPMSAHREIQGKRKDGTIFPAEASISKLIEGDEVTFTAILRDVTKRKAIENQIRNQVAKLQALREIDIAITGSLDLRVIIKVILDQVTSQLKVDAADILLLNPQTRYFEYGGSRGFNSDRKVQTAQIRHGESFVGHVSLDRELLHIQNLSESEMAPSFAEMVAEENFVSYYCLPLISKGHVQGVLELYNRTIHNPNKEWFGFLEALGIQTAIAIDNVSLFDSLQKANEKLILAYDTTLEGWVRALAFKDEETEEHSHRVTDMTCRLAKIMGLDDDVLVHVRRGSLLHDIGKMGIPEHILLKPGNLSDEEREIIEKHPVYAFEWLSPIEYLRTALDIPYCHHEKWDGTGYPRGLQGKQIPLPARIFSVVDTWDALISDRPYRKAWHLEKVYQYLKDQRGKHFDPQVVDEFLKFMPPEAV